MDARQETFGLVVRSLLAAAGIAVLVLAAVRLRELLVLAFGAVVIGVLIRALADAIERRTPLGGKGAFYAALLLLDVFLGDNRLYVWHEYTSDDADE